MDKISIVVAVYNAEKTIKKCVDSLLNQTYENTEIILVNDCSKDKSLEICKAYAENNRNIFIVDNDVNQGVSATRNNGIEKSSGNYICFVDSDDYVESDYLEKLYIAINDYNSKLSICGSEFHNMIDNTSQRFIWSDCNLIERVSLAEGFKLSNALYLNALWNKLFRTDLIKDKNIRFDTNLSMGEDAKFSLDYIKANKITEVVVLSLPLYHYIRWNNNSLMSGYFEQASGDYADNIRALYEIVKPLNPNADLLYKDALKKTKSNLKYGIIRSKARFKEKREKIKNLYPEYSVLDFISDYIMLFKEKAAKILNR